MSLDTTRPFTRAAGLAAGLTDHALRSPRFRQLLRGIYLDAQVPVTGEIEARAGLLAGRTEAFVSFHTAARLYGAVVPHSERTHISVPAGATRAHRADLAVHASRRNPGRFRGLPVTTPDDTFLDLSICLPLVDLVILGDGLVRRGRTTPQKLVEAAAAHSGRGCRLARRAAALVRTGVDSPMETRARMLRVLSRLPELETDIRIYDDEGNLIRRLDAGDRATRTAVEYDGRHHIERESQWHADLGRREEFENDEWRIVTLVSKDIFTSPGRTIDRLVTVFRSRGLTVGQLSDEWRRHFPDRG